MRVRDAGRIYRYRKMHVSRYERILHKEARMRPCNKSVQHCILTKRLKLRNTRYSVRDRVNDDNNTCSLTKPSKRGITRVRS